MKIKSKKTLVIALAAGLILIAGGVYAYSRNSDNSGEQTTPEQTSDGIDNPPTAEEQQSGDSAKEKFEDNNKFPNDDSNKVKSVKPDITYGEVYQGNVEVSSRVPGIFEKSGKCTLDLKKSEKTVSQSKTAVPNVSEMSCGVIKIPTTKLSSGTWSATITYSSVKAKGVSDTLSIKVK